MQVLSTTAGDIEIASESGDRVPMVSARALPVAALVHACHEKTIDDGLAALGMADFDRGALDRILTYCAELRCESDRATCPGCKRRTEARGLDTLDDFIAAHKEIIVGDGSVRLVGKGTETLTTPAIAALEKTWSGENYWFWSRRVLRKLRHGIRRAHITGEPVAGPAKRRP